MVSQSPFRMPCRFTAWIDIPNKWAKIGSVPFVHDRSDGQAIAVDASRIQARRNLLFGWSKRIRKRTHQTESYRAEQTAACRAAVFRNPAISCYPAPLAIMPMPPAGYWSSGARANK